MDELGRRPLVQGLSLAAALELLQAHCTASQLTDVLQALQQLCVNVVAHPEEASFRTVRLLNAHFQEHVACRPGGVEALLALGFVESESIEVRAMREAMRRRTAVPCACV